MTYTDQPSIVASPAMCRSSRSGPPSSGRASQPPVALSSCFLAQTPDVVEVTAQYRYPIGRGRSSRLLSVERWHRRYDIATTLRGRHTAKRWRRRVHYGTSKYHPYWVSLVHVCGRIVCVSWSILNHNRFTLVSALQTTSCKLLLTHLRLQ
jgi:hypothetical protein